MITPYWFPNSSAKTKGNTTSRIFFFPLSLSFVNRDISGRRLPYSVGFNSRHTEGLLFPTVACPSWEGDAGPRALLNRTRILTARQRPAQQFCSHLLLQLSHHQERDGCLLDLTGYALSLFPPRHATGSRRLRSVS